MKLENIVFVEVFRKNLSEIEESIVEKCLACLKTKRISLTKNEQTVFKSKLVNLLRTFKSFYKKHHRTWLKLKEFKSGWLSAPFDFNFKPKTVRKTTLLLNGRPHIPYLSKKPRARRMAVAALIEKAKNSTELLLKAAECSGRRSGNQNLAKSIKNVIKQHKLTPQEGLLMIIEADLSQRQYLRIKSLLKSRGNDVLPSHNDVLKVRKKCRPSELELTNNSANIPVQNLLDHTAERIIAIQENKLVPFSKSSEIHEIEVTLTSKWGFDGSSGQSQYNQEVQTGHDDSNLFAVTLTPLLMNYDDLMVWKNPTPSSVRYCRVLSIEYIKESKEVNLAKYKFFQEQIETLNSTIVILSNGISIKVKHQLHMTQVDGKVVSHVTDTSSFQRCSTCNALPSQMNKLENLENGTFEPDVSTTINSDFPFFIAGCGASIVFFILDTTWILSFGKLEMKIRKSRNLESLKFKNPSKIC